MNINISSRDRVLLYHTVLVVAANFVPIPFADDFIVQVVRQHMVQELAKTSLKQKLPVSESLALSWNYRIGCGFGCSTLVMYIIREFLREILIVIDIQRGVSLAADTYLYGYLLDQLFTSKRYNPAHARAYANIIPGVITKENKNLVKQSLKGSLKTSGRVLRAISSWLLRFFWYHTSHILKFAWGKFISILSRLTGRGVVIPIPDRLQNFDRFFDGKQPEVNALIETLTAQIQPGLGSLPAQFFETMTTNLFAALSQAGL